MRAARGFEHQALRDRVLMIVLLVILFLLHGEDPPASGTARPIVVVLVPLDPDGRVDLSTFVARLAQRTQASVKRVEESLLLPVRGVAGAITRSLIDEALQPGVRMTVAAESLRIEIDAANLEPERRRAWETRLNALANRVRREARIHRQTYGMKATASYRPNDPNRPTICLIHGMNSNSGCFVHMIPLLEQVGFGVVVYDFPDNQDLDLSAPAFAKDWREFRERTGDRQAWAIVAHSMGGLMARWYVEGADYRDDVSTLVLIAPPNQGSALAKAQGLFQLVQNVQATNGRHSGALVELSEGLGEAADDLKPSSAFLKSLNARSRREGLRYHILAGDAGFLTPKTRGELDTRLALGKRAAGVLGRMSGVLAGDLAAQLDELTEGTGDGAVSVASTRLDGVTDHVVIHANHVELIRGPLLYPDPGPVVCMPYLRRWLARAEPSSNREGSVPP